MRKIFLLSTALSLALAVNPYSYIMKQRQTSKSANFDVKEQSIAPKKTGIDTYLDSTVANDILNNMQNPQTVSYAENKNKILADNVSVYKKKLYKLAKSKNTAKKAKKPAYYFVGGYCSVENEVKILASDGFAMLKCSLDFGKGYKNVEVFAQFVPDYKREMLIAFPVYAKIDGKRYPATGYFMNSKKTSLNIADYVDSAKIRALLSKSLLIANDIAYKQATAYMNALQQSQQSQQVTYYSDSNSNTTTPIVTTNYQKPNPKDYWSVGLVEFVSALVKLFGENYLDNLKPLFAVHKGSMLYTEMVINENEKELFTKFGKINENRLKSIQKDNNLYNKDLLRGVNTQ